MNETDTPTPLSEGEDLEEIEFPNAMDIQASEGTSQESNTLDESRERPQDLQPDNLADAIAIIHQLRQDKRQLQERVWDLEATLNRIEHGPEIQQSVSRATSEILDGDAARRQQSLVETIRAKLQTCEHQMARMEREFALTQQRYNEQTYQLQQSEQTCEELRSRLNRQQRYTLQFKAALEKCLEEVEIRNGNLVTANTAESVEPMYFAPAQPVEPWSMNGMEVDAALEEATNVENIEEISEEIATSAESATIPVESYPVDSQESHLDTLEQAILDDGGEEDEENLEGATDENAKISETETAPTSPPEPKPIPIPEASVLPPELPNRKRQPLSKVDLPKFPRLNE